MFPNILRSKPDNEPNREETSLLQIIQDERATVSIRMINNLYEIAKRRIYRGFIPPRLLTAFDINPISWEGLDGNVHVFLDAEPGTSEAKICAKYPWDSPDCFLTLELFDNQFGGIELGWIALANPMSERFSTDVDENGEPTYLGSVRRNLREEERAKDAGYAPGQVRDGMRGSREVFEQLDSFFATLSHPAYFLEPLTYVSAWVFERRGFAYVRGHAMMDEIHREFQPGGKLNDALDGSTPFRQPHQWTTIRGRAWAIHDGILEVIGKRWDKVRMLKRIGYHAHVDTTPDISY